MSRWTVYDWVGRIGMYLALYAVIEAFGWYGVLFIAGVIMVIIALLHLRGDDVNIRVTRVGKYPCGCTIGYDDEGNINEAATNPCLKHG